MSLSEFEIIEQYFRDLTGNDDQVVLGIGDDAAVIAVPPGRQLVTSVDTLVGGVHFFFDTHPMDIGYKSLAVNLSDLAAMGATPRWCLLSLSMQHQKQAWLEYFAQGFAAVAKEYNVSLVGGDLSRGLLSITVQVMGLVDEDRFLTRAGANAGDLIYISGTLGGPALAIKSLQSERDQYPPASEQSMRRLNRPEPRIELGKALAGIASACIDISDGLTADLGHILKQSGKGAEVNVAKIPVSEDVQQTEDPNRLYQLVLAGGDDYELCFTVPEDQVGELDAIQSSHEIALTCIGRVMDGTTIKWIREAGSEIAIPEQGYEHSLLK